MITRLNSNFVVLRFGDKIRKEDVLRDIKPIKRTINGENYIIYPIRRCIWQRTAGNLFLVKGEGYDDFILKSYLEIEGNYFKKKENFCPLCIISSNI